MLRRLGAPGRRRRDRQPRGDRRVRRGIRRRLLDHGAQAQSGPLGAHPPRGTDRGSARRDAAHRGRASVDERADGAWHAEWATLRTLARRTVIAAAHTTELLTGLRVDADRAAANLMTAGDLGAEQRTMADLTGRPPNSGYLGAAGYLVDTALDRAARYRKDAS